jgi:branched-chain amino acid transport system ATP-binding protein
MTKGAFLEVRGVSAAYEGIRALHRVDLTVRPGTVTAVLGANGAGKSTLLSVIAGLLSPIEGEVFIDGDRTTGRDAAALARRGLCLVPEGRGVFPNLTVRENLWIMTHSGATRREVEGQAFDQFPGLFPRREQQAGTLSGGEQQMLALARAVATRPRLLLLDELSMGLAPRIVSQLYDHVSGLALAGVTVVVVEQFAQTALAVATSCVVMANGRVVRAGSSGEVTGRLQSAYLGAQLSENGPVRGALR